MQITKVQNWQGGYKVNDQFFIPQDENNLDYQDILLYLDNGGIIDPEFTDVQLVAIAKSDKITELNTYHNSSEVRTLTINGTTAIALDSITRTLVNEQVIHLNNQIELGDKTAETAIFNYYTGSTFVPISLENLKKISVEMLSITNANYATYQNCLAQINNLETVATINNFDFEILYIKNSTINLL